MASTSQSDGVIWSDVNTRYGENSDPELLIDVAAINNALFNLFSCPIGSRPYKRRYGTYLLYQLMQPVDRETADDLLFGLIQSIEEWEPRVIVSQQQSSIAIFNGGAGLEVTIFYSIRRLNQTAEYKFTAQKV